ncbi:hypothetical protein BJ684DRAFT_22939 [Piptocephalis cylindrospora]|uniref:EamA domain-containing protein n=1 Tax=Piptocephalis cylindrospora TaxID=1907219 RepID=A0A4P9Y1Y6_9FUNG|nr:hypothetical protein BJ684DRAFT_22939 [Piptocephalis cylindrospora]|eukprot:RKP12868.1 hypothetical protein BJ684DRAFT_22939 [Piptocephalis cylindrospora]
MGRPSRRYALGLMALLGVVVLWTSSSYAISYIFLDHSFNKPFFLTFLNTSTFSLYLLPDTKEVGQRVTPLRPSSPTVSLEPLSLGRTARASLSFCILWFAANWTLNAALAYTSVASSTIISSTSALFTLILGVGVGVERFSSFKLLAVLASIFGVCLVTYADLAPHPMEVQPLANPPTHLLNSLTPPAQPAIPPPSHALPPTILGDLLALSGAFFYGAYATFLKRDLRDERRVDPQMFLGFVGLFNLVLLWPIFFIFHYTGVETFELPSTSLVWIMLLANALVGTFLSDYLWLLAMLMTSPLVVTLGLSLTIPLALVGDMVRKGVVPGVGYWIGAILVLLGFFLVNSSTLGEETEEEEGVAIEDGEEEGLDYV